MFSNGINYVPIREVKFWNLKLQGILSLVVVVYLPLSNVPITHVKQKWRVCKHHPEILRPSYVSNVT